MLSKSTAIKFRINRPFSVRPTPLNSNLELDTLQASLRIAIQNLDIKAVYNAIKQGAPINRQDKEANDGHNDYHLVRATYKGDIDIVSLLLQAGAYPDVSCEHGHTPLLIAAARYRHEIMRLVIAAGADVNHQDNDGKSALMEVASRCDLPGMAILKNANANNNLIDNKGKTALLEACESFALQLSELNRRISVIKNLVDSSVINLADHKGMTPLMALSDAGILEACALLLSAGADKYAINHQGQTAADLSHIRRQQLEAQIQEQTKIITLLSHINASPVHDEVISLDKYHHAKENNIFNAIYSNDLNEVAGCIDEGIDVNLALYNQTCLIQAASLGHLEIVELLLAHGAKAGQIYKGKTALDAAKVSRTNRQEEAEKYGQIQQLLRPSTFLLTAPLRFFNSPANSDQEEKQTTLKLNRM